MHSCRWNIVHIGTLACNPYWGESNPVREQCCTSTLIRAEGRTVLVDPGNLAADRMAEALFAYSGLKPEDVDTVFLTHFHTHHSGALSLFPASTWMMSEREIRWWDEKESLQAAEANILSRMIPMDDHPVPRVKMIPTPGHTPGSASLLVETRDGMVMVVGDAVLTFDHFEDRSVASHAWDKREALRTMNQIAKLADVIIPGHANAFVV